MPPSAERGAREAIALIALAAFTAGISLRCVEPMLPKLAAEFGVSVSAASLVITAFAAAYAGAVLLQGPLGDRYGKLRIVTIGTALAGAASLACAAAWDLGSLAAARFLMAAFASAPMALGMAYIGDVVPLAARQMTIARFVAGSIFGQTLGPLFGGLFTDRAGWRASFLVIGVVFLASAAALLVRTRRNWPALLPGRFAPFGTHVALLRRRAVRWLVAIGVTETFFFFGAFVFVGAFLRARYDLSFTLIGLVLAGYGVGGLVYSALVRWFVRTLGERGLVFAGGLLALFAYLAIVLAPDWLYAIPCTVALGAAFYLLHNTIQTKATEVAPDARGSAMALYACAWAVGQALGAGAAGIAVASLGYASAIGTFALGFALLGFWLRYNLFRLRP